MKTLSTRHPSGISNRNFCVPSTAETCLSTRAAVTRGYSADSSARSFEERRNFVKRRGRDILKWTAQELMLNPRSAGQIGDIRFYKPVTIGVMRVPQIEIKYEVKDTSVFEKGA